MHIQALTARAQFAGGVVIMLYAIESHASFSSVELAVSAALQWIINSVIRDVCAVSPAGTTIIIAFRLVPASGEAKPILWVEQFLDRPSAKIRSQNVCRSTIHENWIPRKFPAIR